MLKKPFEQTIRQLCEDVLSEPTPEALPAKIIDHVQMTFPVQWSTLWLTEQKGTSSEKRLRLAAAGGVAKKLLTAEKGGPAMYDFNEGLTGEIAQLAQTRNITNYGEFKKHKHAKKYDNVMYEGSKAEDECRCVLGVPLLLKSIGEANASENQPWRVIGVLKLENIQKSTEHSDPFFTPQDAEIVEAYAAVIAVALEKAQTRADSMRIAAGLLDVSRSLLAELGEQPRLKQIVEQTANVISAEACSLWLRSGLQLRLAAAYGYQNSGDQVPPYQLEQQVDPNNDAKAGTKPDDSGEQAQYRGVGLTVYVAKTVKSLNLTTADEIRNHFAWRGANDQRMWAKPRGSACYSLVAVPLVDNETRDLRGVFKIENKKPTLFQLQSFFTREDEQLLTILGNSISSSLIIAERIERLRTLEKLVGDVRILSNLDEALFFILTGLTHRDGLQYNRAMIFLADEAKPNPLVCQFAVGQIDPADWQREMDKARDRPFLDLDKLLKEFRADKQKYLQNPMIDKWRGREVDISSTDGSLIARYAATLRSGPNQELHTTKYASGELPSGDMLSSFASGDFVLIPITVEKSLRGIIYADNRFTGNHVNRFECSMLDLFAGMAGAIIQASGVPQKLQQERDEAWQAFSRPAAHRLGTEAVIIGTEAELYIKRELEHGILAPDGRIAVRSDVIVNSLTTIQQAVNRLRLAVRDYQRLAFQAEAPVDLDLCELVEQIVQNTTLKGIEVHKRFVDQPLWIHAAHGGITYMFEELLINTWKQGQSDAGNYAGVQTSGMRVLIELRREHDWAVCTFSDSGPGLPASVIPTLFQKPTIGRKGGTGLGLYIIGQILKGNKASIDIITGEKPEGFNGACFKVTFPLCTKPESAQSDTQERPAPSVLVVEDNPVLRRHLFKVLTENGFSCESASNENEAVSRVSDTLRIIIADINLSEAGGRLNGGILLAEDLARMDRKIPIILISADPWYYLPPKTSREFGEMQKRLSIVSVIDRNSNTFYEELVRTLMQSTRG